MGWSASNRTSNPARVFAIPPAQSSRPRSVPCREATKWWRMTANNSTRPSRRSDWPCPECCTRSLVHGFLMALYAIGDVQGCDTELGALLNVLKFSADRDSLWFVGDLVNRGPDSLKVLRRIRALGDAATVILGNHDLHLLAVAYGGARLRSDDTLADVLAAPDRAALLEWLQERPLLHEDAGLNVCMVHAGLAPQWDLNQARG